MKLGLFTMPSHPPERGLGEGHDWDLQNLVWADELGFEEAWIGEHHAMVWEPHRHPAYVIFKPNPTPHPARRPTPLGHHGPTTARPSRHTSTPLAPNITAPPTNWDPRRPSAKTNMAKSTK